MLRGCELALGVYKETRRAVFGSRELVILSTYKKGPKIVLQGRPRSLLSDAGPRALISAVATSSQSPFQSKQSAELVKS